MGTDQPAISGGMHRVLAENGSTGLSGINSSPFCQHLFGGLDRIIQAVARSRAAGCLDHALNKCGDF